MGNPNGLRTVFLILPPMFVLLPLSIIIVVLERISTSLFTTHTARNWRSGDSTITLYGPTTSDATSLSKYTEVTVRVRVASTLALLGLSLAAIVVAAIGVCGIWELRRIEGSPRRQRGWSWVMLVLNTLTMVASVGLLAYLSVLQGNEKRWKSYADVGKDGQKFTRETWACQINEFYTSERDWAGPACALDKANRFMLIPLAVSSALVIFCTWILIHDRGGAKWLVGGKGRYAGFDDTIELQHPRQDVPKGGMANNNHTVYL
ncbi:hypothetical protein K505DRAFT_377728 [Melanomma pulvis-pyrius CBS 109.77]|uniref:Uncharacterized protein n=1 Tax=Melanomma pulvis-pyrius CBS 109.77 TaxID=1314802 RepID=A0A6A6X1T4_9PLEO|nr:hypothetical protein K505DRAFT_377728 [Melanomma pulvis-pyrius CBS 109.77]